MKILATALALAASVGVASAASISTTADYWTTLDVEPRFGAASFGTYGQTIKIEGETKFLTDFGMAVNDVDPFSPVTFNAHVYAWDHATKSVTGGPLFTQSGLSTGDGVDIGGDLSILSINTGLLELVAGDYVLLLQSTFGGPAGVAVSYDDAYQDGYAVVVDDFLGVGAAGMFEKKAYDATFVVNFSEVPLGASLPLLGTALAALGIATRRRRKA